MPRRLQLSIFLWLLTFASSAAGAWRVDDAERVVAIADVHGAYEAMVETLQRASVIGEELGWSGGKTHLVIVGDILDRGPRSRDVMDLLMRIESEALAAGGQVHVLIGNHESMNLIGDLRYVSKSEYLAFADDETPDERERWLASYAARQGASTDHEELRKHFDEQFPPGYFALRRAFAPDGRYGKWLLTKPVIMVINGTAFVHGGLSPAINEIGLEGVNGRLKSELARFVKAQQQLIDAGIFLPTDSYYDTRQLADAFLPSIGEDDTVIEAIATIKRLSESELFDTDGPLWYRGNVACSPIIEEHRLSGALQVIGADRVVVGHTPTPTRGVLQRFGGRLIEIDTGMLADYYRGSGNALVLAGDSVMVLNQSGGEPLQPADHPRLLGTRPGMMSAEALSRLLSEGEVVSELQDESGSTIVAVSDGKRTVSGIFTKRASRNFYPDVAAYRLDRLLELNMVPVTVRRKINGDDGSLQFLTSKRIDESQRSASGRGGGASCELPEQWTAMYVFDVFIYNEGRTQSRMLYDVTNWSLMLMKHDRAFAAKKGRPRHLREISLDVDEGWRAALQKLTDEDLRSDLRDVLPSRHIRSLSARRDELLAIARKQNGS
ncbi:MAG: metallophosphoesterase [Gammaproteobacteria bacterium]|nr:metallophosphoesterase [Gammaproteobacteria bacterium]